MKIITYYKKYTGKSKSIVDALKKIGVSSSMENRKKIAALNGIKDYTGTGAQNKKMLDLLKKGKLIKSITIKIVETNAQKFVHQLNEIDKLYAKYGKHISYGSTDTPKNYASAKKKLESGKSIHSTCVVPIKWGLAFFNMKYDNFYSKKGSFVNFTDSMKKYLTKKSGQKYTVKEAVDKKFLKPGDICCFEGLTHTFAYTGKEYLCFDGGHAAVKNNKYSGIIVDYNTSSYKYKRISYILRWK
jgi:hypothetical protein